MFKSAAKSILRAAFRNLPIAVHRPALLRIRRSAFQVPALVPAGFHSQKGQDFRVFELLGGLDKGTFVDVGAFDGVTGSNSLYFERELGWSGLCIEPNPDAFELLEACRQSTCVKVAVSGSAGPVPFVKLSGPSAQLSGIENQLKEEKVAIAVGSKGSVSSLIRVPSARLGDLLASFEIARVDFLSVDVEGSELEVLQTVDFSSVEVLVICVENSRRDNAIDLFLRSQGFVLSLTIGREEEIFTHRKLLSNGQK